ncbi:Endoglucanase [Ignavibacterium album JCM 16511]|uniref:Endoglucanase n=1 Tax=Ignavibacterium album (strain DSM 19864 / JCM 16511 / NBRC 101810 / Mat9-16) TaxID=945713 RepID=I0AMT9_IGNAJ|nr:glycoside hydrolase family 5 protein [Ignavibacterium album]AFH50296.1 Endoglucanase [Ignavibacterium album JCM 16511]
MKTRNNFLFFLIASLLIIISTASYPQSKNFFSVKGKEIIDPGGNPILLKGINLGNWLVPEGYMFHFSKINSPQFIYFFFNTLIGPEEANKFWQDFRKNYVTREDIHLIKSLGFNSVRIPFNYSLFITDYPYYELKGVGYELLDSVIYWCKQENLYVILDMHCAPAGQTGDNIDDSFGYPFLFDSPLAQEHTTQIWKRLAEIYKDEEIVIGYDLLNEPIAHYFDVDRLKPLLEPLYKKITTAIRKVDSNHIIFLGGAIWDSDFSIFNKPFDDKLVYTFHKYWTEPTQDVIQSYIDFRDKYDVPILLGESGENTNEWINDFRKVLEKNNIGWCFWPYKKLDSERGVVSINKPNDYDLIKEFAESFELSYEYIREHRPDINKVKEVLKNYLENCKIHNCTLNENYIKALGLK